MSKICAVAASQAIDSSGEILDIAGCDISALLEGKGFLSWEHEDTKEDPENVVGKITFAKKIFTAQDCDTPLQLKYLKMCHNIPFLYVEADLFDSSGHPGAECIKAIMRYAKAKGEPMEIGTSIEGLTLSRSGNKLLQTIAKGLTCTTKSANKQAFAQLAEENPQFQKALGKDNYKPLSKGLSISTDDCFLEDVKTDLQQTITNLVDFSHLAKALDAGMPVGAPGTNVGGAALAASEDESYLKGPAVAMDKKSSMKDWLKNKVKKKPKDHDADFTPSGSSKVPASEEYTQHLKDKSYAADLKRKGFSSDEIKSRLKKFVMSELEKGLNGDWQKQGYKIKAHPGYEGNEENDEYTTIEAHKGNKLVGNLIVGHSHPEFLETQDVGVHPSHQRKGLATAMYQEAERITGKKMKPSWSRTEDAHALWAQPNRPFGKSDSHITDKLLNTKFHQHQHPEAFRVKAKLLAALRDREPHQSYQEVVKSALADIGPNFIQHFDTMVHDLSLRKSDGIASFRSTVAHIPHSKEQKMLIAGLRIAKPNSDSAKTINSYGDKVLVRRGHNSKEDGLFSSERAAIYHNLAKDVFQMGDHVPQTSAYMNPTDNNIYHATHLKDQIMHGYEPKHKEAYDNHLKNVHEALHKMAIMDYVLGHSGRDVGSTKVTPEGHIWLTDNEHAFNQPVKPEYLQAKGEGGPIDVSVSDWLAKIDPRAIFKAGLTNGLPKHKAREMANRLMIAKDKLSKRNVLDDLWD